MSNIPEEFRLSRAELESLGTQYPFFKYDTDARCNCGEKLEYHRDFLFSKTRTGHREAVCQTCRIWTQYNIEKKYRSCDFP